MDRLTVDHTDLRHAVDRATTMLFERVRKHGPGAYASAHEAAGVMLEEWDEVQGALRSDDPEAFDEEVMDLAVACLFHLASSQRKHRRRMARGSSGQL